LLIIANVAEYKKLQAAAVFSVGSEKNSFITVHSKNYLAFLKASIGVGNKGQFSKRVVLSIQNKRSIPQ
jgi:hypothetical protein